MLAKPHFSSIAATRGNAPTTCVSTRVRASMLRLLGNRETISRLPRMPKLLYLVRTNLGARVRNVRSSATAQSSVDDAQGCNLRDQSRNKFYANEPRFAARSL